MELLTFLLDFILHVDKYLEAFVTNYGLWVYALLFLVIFVETGVVVMPFLPGDSLLFVVGAMCGVGLMSYPLSVGLLFAAAVLANRVIGLVAQHGRRKQQPDGQRIAHQPDAAHRPHYKQQRIAR